MQLIDTHTHLFLPQFDEDRPEVIQRAQEESIQKFLLPNIDKDTIADTWQMTEDYPEACHAMMGLHPCSVGGDYKEHLKAVEKELGSDKPIYAIGETGLDFYWDDSYVEEQKTAFRRHLKWAKEMKLPVVIHCRNSFEAIYDMLIEENGPDLEGVLHCFTGSLGDAGKILGAGFYLGIGGILTFKNAGLDQVVPELPMDRLLLETDSPYLAPQPNRGKRNESAYMIHTAKKLAEVKGMGLAEVAEETSANAKRLFQLSGD